MEARRPQALSTRGLVLPFNKVYPVLHALELAFQDFLVTVMQVAIPRDHRGRLAPGRTAALDHAAHRHHMRNRALQLALLIGQVAPVFAVKSVGIHIKGRRAGERLSVARPPHALVTLRAVGRHIDKVALLAPDGIEEQAVN